MIGAGSASAGAVDALEPFNGFINFHTLNQLADTLQIAVAAAQEAAAFDDIILNFQFDFARTYAAGDLSVFHVMLLFQYIQNIIIIIVDLDKMPALRH